MSRRPYKYCKRSDCPDCNESESSCHIDASKEEDEFISFPIFEALGSKNQNVTEDLSNQKEKNLNPRADNSACPNWLNTWSHDDLVSYLAADPILVEIKLLKQNFENKPSREYMAGLHPTVRNYCSKWELITLKNELLYFKTEKCLHFG